MKMNAVPKTVAAGDQPGSRNPAAVTPPFKQKPIVKQVTDNLMLSMKGKVSENNIFRAPGGTFKTVKNL